MNSTYRAITKAGFNGNTFQKLANVIIITEPEAAALYTARHLKEIDGQNCLRVSTCTDSVRSLTENIQLNEYFIVCDAGGGTVVGVFRFHDQILL